MSDSLVSGLAMIEGPEGADVRCGFHPRFKARRYADCAGTATGESQADMVLYAMNSIQSRAAWLCIIPGFQKFPNLAILLMNRRRTPDRCLSALVCNQKNACVSAQSPVGAEALEQNDVMHMIAKIGDAC